MTSKCEYGCDGGGTISNDGIHIDGFCVCMRLAWAGIPQPLRSKRFDNFDAGRVDEQVARVRAWVDAFEHGCPSLMLYGFGKGTGKTHLMAAAAHHIAAHKVQPLNAGMAFMLAPNVFVNITSDVDKFNADIEKASNARLLFLDDVGQADEGDPAWLRAKKRDAYFRLINHRETNGLTTVCTSNLETVEQFADVLGEAAADRLLGMCGKPGLIKFSGIKSYRLRSFEL